MRDERINKYLNAEELHKINQELHDIDEQFEIWAVREKDGVAIAVECQIEIKGKKEEIRKLKEKGWKKIWGHVFYGRKLESYMLYLEEG